MKKILYIFFIFIFIFPFKVLAIENRFTLGNNVDGLIVPTSAFFYKNNNGSLTLGTNNNATIGYFQSGDYIPIGYGTALGFSLNTPVSPDFYYALTIYGGANKNVNSYIKPASYYTSNSLLLHIGQYVGDAVNRFGSNTANVTYTQTIYDQLALQINNSNTGDYANYIVYIFKPNISGTGILVPLELYPNSNYGMMFYGYTLQVLGNANNLSSSDIENVISSSGLATATSINEVKSSINTAKQEITTKIEQEEKKTQQAIDKNTEATNKTNDLIESDDEDTTSKKCGMICKLKGIFTGIIELPGKLVSLLVNALKSLFIPDSMDFIYDFLDSLESKLGFIGEVPSKVIKFGLDLASFSWTDVTTLTLPPGNIMGYTFWEGQEIDISPAMVIITPIKYLTDIVCVCLCVATLNRWRDRFTGGGE